MAATANSPLVLIIRDGWGRNPHPEHDAFNAVKLARKPVDDALMRGYPSTLIHTSGEDVGLPEGTMGNSEVGHQNIGAGRIVDQESVRITKAVRSGALLQNEAIAGAVNHARESGRAVHLMGIVSDAGVHGLLSHLYGLLDVCKELNHDRVFIHAFTDGRDTGPFTGKAFIEQVEAEIDRRWARSASGAPDKSARPRIASVIGRYWAMDRDNRWERVARAYACLTGRSARERAVATAPTASDAVQTSYDNPPTPSQRGDEFVAPTMIGATPEELCSSRITSGDTVIFYNYRGDRPRELTRAFVYPQFHGHVPPSPDTGEKGFDRGERLDLRFVTLTAYAEDLAPFVSVAFPKPPKMTNIAGDHLSRLGLAQFRCAETEKFPHVTFFFNDYRDDPFPGERRAIIQSPRVATYDLQPEMSAPGVRDAVLARLGAQDCEPFIVVNFANADMVGHTGSLEAAIRAVEAVDECVGAIVEATLARNGALIITADHGNAEQMWDPDTGAPHTAHTTYEVPLIVVGERFRGRALRAGGRLADIVPTALDIMGLAKPPEMTGETLLD